MLLTEYNAEEQRKLDRRDAKVETKVDDVDQLINRLNLSLEESCDIIGITVETYQTYKKNQ